MLLHYGDAIVLVPACPSYHACLPGLIYLTDVLKCSCCSRTVIAVIFPRNSRKSMTISEKPFQLPAPPFKTGLQKYLESIESLLPPLCCVSSFLSDWHLDWHVNDVVSVSLAILNTKIFLLSRSFFLFLWLSALLCHKTSSELSEEGNSVNYYYGTHTTY